MNDVSDVMSRLVGAGTSLFQPVKADCDSNRYGQCDAKSASRAKESRSVSGHRV